MAISITDINKLKTHKSQDTDTCVIYQNNGDVPKKSITQYLWQAGIKIIFIKKSKDKIILVCNSYSHATALEKKFNITIIDID